MAVATVPPQNIQLTATEPDEIAQCQQHLIAWGKAKIAELTAEATELGEAYKRAVTVKWKSEPMKRLWDKALKRVSFYQKMVSALEHGFVIIPNFPVTVFAIRTDKLRALKLVTTRHWDTHEQKSPGLPEGEGEYQNPFPVIWSRTLPAPTQQEPKKTITEYWGEEFKELEFPIQMAKPKIMEATSRAMALKIFDDFGIMPERQKEDPIIVARLKDPRGSKHSPRFITFMVAWHLDTRDL